MANHRVFITVDDRLVDVHCHCLPGLDDGPRDLSESLALSEALVSDGFSDIVATPHQLGRYQGDNTRETVVRARGELLEALEAEGIPLRIHLGADVRIDADLPRLVATGQALTVCDQRRYLLLELPHDLYIDPGHTIRELSECGTQTILTHPERYRYLASAIEPVEHWRSLGAVVQVTAGSLLGDFGRTAHDFAWRLVRGGLADVVATDSHGATNRPPRQQAAMERLRFEVGASETSRLCVENPRSILQGDPIESSSRFG